jgi:ribosomal protein S18 acetylase RimI-like enzyme
MVEAEARARDFDCDWAVLHVDERNTVGQQLYKKLGYRTVARQNWLEAVVEGRNEGERLLLLVKKL